MLIDGTLLVVPTHCRCREILLHLITLNATLTHSIGHFWTNNRPVAETTTCTIHNIHKRQTSMSLAGFEPAVPASKWPQTHAATGMGCWNIWNKCLRDYRWDVCLTAEKRECFEEVCCFHLQGGNWWPQFFLPLNDHNYARSVCVVFLWLTTANSLALAQDYGHSDIGTCWGVDFGVPYKMCFCL